MGGLGTDAGKTLKLVYKIGDCFRDFHKYNKVQESTKMYKKENCLIIGLDFISVSWSVKEHLHMIFLKITFHFIDIRYFLYTKRDMIYSFGIVIAGLVMISFDKPQITIGSAFAADHFAILKNNFPPHDFH